MSSRSSFEWLSFPVFIHCSACLYVFVGYAVKCRCNSLFIRSSLVYLVCCTCSIHGLNEIVCIVATSHGKHFRAPKIDLSAKLMPEASTAWTLIWKELINKSHLRCSVLIMVPASLRWLQSLGGLICILAFSFQFLQLLSSTHSSSCDKHIKWRKDLVTCLMSKCHYIIIIYFVQIFFCTNVITLL